MANEIMDILLEEQSISNIQSAPGNKALYAELNGLSVAADNQETGLMVTARELAAVDDSANLNITSANVLASLGDMGFRNNIHLKTIVLPADLTEVRRSFFYDCINLTAVTIPAEVQVIDDFAFHGCKNLRSVHFAPNSKLQKIGNYAFADCELLSDITLPEHLAYIGEAAFRCCKSVTRVHIETSANLRYVNKHAFIGNHAFQHCTELSEFVLPFGLDEIRTGLFFGCSALAELQIPTTVNLIDNYAFQDCANLELLYFASDKTKLMPLTLRGLSNKLRIQLSDGREFALDSLMGKLEKQKRGGNGIAISSLVGRSAKTRTA